MKKLSMIVSVLFISVLIVVPAFPSSWQIDVGQDGIDTGGSVNLSGQTNVNIDFIFDGDGYSCPPSDQIFGVLSYLYLDESVIQVNSATPRDDNGCDLALSGCTKREANVWMLICSNFNFINLTGGSLTFATFNVDGVGTGTTVMRLENDISELDAGYGLYADGYVADCNLADLFPDDANVTIINSGGDPTVFPEVATQCPEVVTSCPVVATTCPAVTTECPADPTVCVVTECPEVATQCPEAATECPIETTVCPAGATFCPVVATTCPEITTECPADPTVCVATECPQVATSCPTVATECPAETTLCPVAETTCPTGETFCPATETVCPAALCPLAYKFDFDGDGYWETEWELFPPAPPSPGETAQVDIWLNGYVCPPDDKLFSAQLYFSYDPDALQVIQAYPNTTDRGGPFDPVQSGFTMQEPGVYQLLVAHSDFVMVIGNRILLGTIELERIGAGSTIAVEAADDVGIDPYTDGFMKDCELGSLYPIDAVATIYQPCSEDADCDDGNLCTEEYCDEDTGRCINSVLPDGSPCYNDVFCDGVETCIDGVCQPGTPVECPDDGLFCNGTESCDEAAEDCVSSGNPCGDEEYCNEATDICAGIEALDPPSSYQARWVPLIRRLGIVGSNTNFEARVSKVSFEPKNAVFPLFPKVADGENITVWAYIMPQVLTGLLAEPVQVTVTTGSEAVSADWVIELLPFIESQSRRRVLKRYYNQRPGTKTCNESKARLRGFFWGKGVVPAVTVYHN